MKFITWARKKLREIGDFICDVLLGIAGDEVKKIAAKQVVMAKGAVAAAIKAVKCWCGSAVAPLLTATWQILLVVLLIVAVIAIYQSHHHNPVAEVIALIIVIILG